MKRKREDEIRNRLHGLKTALVGRDRPELYQDASDLLVEVDILRAALIALQTSAAARRQLDREWDARGDGLGFSLAGEVRLERLNAEVDEAIVHAEKVLDTPEGAA